MEIPQLPLMKRGPDFIRIRFTSGSIYLYTYDSACEEDIEEMKELAKEGQGLTRFINEVQPGYVKENVSEFLKDNSFRFVVRQLPVLMCNKLPDYIQMYQ